MDDELWSERNIQNYGVDGTSGFVRIKFQSEKFFKNSIVSIN